MAAFSIYRVIGKTPSETSTALRNILAIKNVSLNPVELGGKSKIDIYAEGNDAEISISNHIPYNNLAVSLSKELDTTVMAFGQDKVTGMYAFQLSEKGETKKLVIYTDHFIKKENVDLVEIFKIATTKRKFNLMPGGNYDTEDALAYNGLKYIAAAYDINLDGKLPPTSSTFWINESLDDILFE